MILVTAVSLGTQPALSGDAVKDVQPSAIAGRVRPLGLVKSYASHVLAAVQSRAAVGSESGQRRAEIRRMADQLFDFSEMARLTLSRHWSVQSRREQEEFVRLFTKLLGTVVSVDDRELRWGSDHVPGRVDQ